MQECVGASGLLPATLGGREGKEGCLLERLPTQAHQGAAHLGAECLRASASAHAEGAEAARLGVRVATHAPVEREGVGTLFSP